MTPLRTIHEDARGHLWVETLWPHPSGAVHRTIEPLADDAPHGGIGLGVALTLAIALIVGGTTIALASAPLSGGTGWGALMIATGGALLTRVLHTARITR